MTRRAAAIPVPKNGQQQDLQLMQLLTKRGLTPLIDHAETATLGPAVVDMNVRAMLLERRDRRGAAKPRETDR